MEFMNAPHSIVDLIVDLNALYFKEFRHGRRSAQLSDKADPDARFIDSDSNVMQAPPV